MRATIRGVTVKYTYRLEKEGYYKDSAYLKLMCVLAKRGANLLDPEDVKSGDCQATLEE